MQSFSVCQRQNIFLRRFYLTKGKTSYKFNIGIYSLFIKRKDCYEGKEKNNTKRRKGGSEI
jgi:hypothetical protein